jgi:diphosphomevalonate decarboxylase
LQTKTAYAHTNIALVKYWGKRPGDDPGLNLPAVGSLSLTLDRFGTKTTVAPTDSPTDILTIDGLPQAERETAKVARFLDRVAGAARPRVRVTSENHVPTAAGLASSASAFAALATAATAAFGQALEEKALSQLARQGSGSAARSVFGGFVVLHPGTRQDGADCFAAPLPDPPGLELRLVVVRCGEGKKAVGSTDGMQHTEQTSPYYPAWVDTHPADLKEAERALAAGDLPALGAVMEHSTLKMHATTMAARPGFFYFQPTTIGVLQAVTALRHDGVGAWATMDAGPHVKVLCRAHDAAVVTDAVSAVAGVRGVDVCGRGPGAHLLNEHL